MAVYVENSNNVFDPRDIRSLPVPDIPIFDITGIRDLIRMEQEIAKEERDNILKSLDKLTEYEDKLLAIKVDAPQRERLESLKKQFGLTDDAFNITDVNALKSPYAMRGLGRRINSMMSHPDFIEIVRDKDIADKFRASIPNISDVQMRALAVKQYNDYLDGKQKAIDLNVKDFEPVNIYKEMVELVKLVPEVSKDEYKVDAQSGIAYVEETKGRDLNVVNKLIANLVNTNPAFRNNLIAKGYITPEGVETDEFFKLKKGLIEGYVEGNVNITGLTRLPNQKDDQQTITSRFGDSTADERYANILDSEIYNSGYELPRASEVLNAAMNKGRFIIGDDGSAHIEIPNENPMAQPTRIPVRKRKVGTASARFSLPPTNFSGSAYDDITKIFGIVESAGDYSAYAPSVRTGALGKYQFIYSWHKDLIKQALEEEGVDYRKEPINKRIKSRSNKNISEEDLRIMSAFLNSEAAQDNAWAKHYAKLQNDAFQLASEGYGGNLSMTELMYLLHHEGPIENVRSLIRTGKSVHDSKGNPRSTYEVSRALDKIRELLRMGNFTGEIMDDGRMQTAGVAAARQKEFNIMDLIGN